MGGRGAGSWGTAVLAGSVQAVLPTAVLDNLSYNQYLRQIRAVQGN